MKAQVFDEVSARMEEEKLITISRAHFAKLLGNDDYGKRIADYKSEVYYRQSIKKELYNDEKLAG
ncbi:hypothetical protein A2U01_0067966, partial [Trifolium medium]|nr:hypothetical protein [Trifolium medium]